MAFGRIRVSNRELSLDHTLPTGQTFRWRKLDSGGYIGVIGRRVVRLALGLFWSLTGGHLYDLVVCSAYCANESKPCEIYSLKFLGICVCLV